VEHCLVVPSDSVHRIQEAQVAVAGRLCRLVQARLEASAP
jgi:diadenosine tetraphosphate (Ap4A) HIT family hydrolase